MQTMINRFVVAVSPILMSVCLSGCSGPVEDAATSSAPVAESGHTHDGWWCSEHGVPEAECALCDVTLVADFKAKGDWCDEHNRPESQCFICNPALEAEFAALYEAKYGEAPPPVGTPHDEGHDDHDHDHDHGDTHDQADES